MQILDPELCKIPDLFLSTVEQVATGMRWAEGPAYFPEGGYLLFTDIPNNRIMKFDEKTNQTSVFRANANYANGNARDRQGRLVTCEHSVTRRITRTEKDGNITVLADKFEGKRLNAPNDIVVKSDDTHLVHRSVVRHQRRMGRQEGKAGAGDHQRLSAWPRTAS